MMRTILPLLFFLLASLLSNAQPGTDQLQNSENGWYLSPHGTIRIFVVFAEIEYDVDKGKDPQPDGADHWQKGQLPKWKDEMFDPNPLKQPRAMVTRYYHDISMGQYTVLGDYYPELITLKESEHRSFGWYSKPVVDELAKRGKFRTKHGLSIEDFDLWKDGGKAGLPKEAGPDDPHSFDHVMVILRNSRLTHGQGSVDQGSAGKIFGYHSDTQSRFGGMYALPFEILKHEYNHMLLGGNNFHSGGGNAPGFQSYFLTQQAGWSLMGAANSSLLTTSAWDRDRVGWRAADAKFNINARSTTGEVIDGDLDPLSGDTGVFVLRDFVTSGDAIRIKIPFLPKDELEQWLWLENHQGWKKNGSPTDRYHWETSGDCIARMKPGIYMLMQVDREEKEGKNIFGGHADYLRPVLANGNYDIRLTGDTIQKSCPFNGTALVHELVAARANPLTGNHEQELPVWDKNGDGRMLRGEHYVPGARKENGRITAQAAMFGRPEHAFTPSGVNKLGMGTNPSTANMVTLVSTGTRDTYKSGKPNNRVVYLNGISVKMLDMEASGAMRVQVRVNDTYIGQDLRWCGDSIVLPNLNGYQGKALWLDAGKTIKLDRSGTSNRMDDSEEYRGKTYFNSATTLTISEDAKVYLDTGSKLELDNGSVLHLLPGSELELGPKAKLKIGRDCQIIVHPGAKIIEGSKAKVDCSGGGCVVQLDQ